MSNAEILFIVANFNSKFVTENCIENKLKCNYFMCIQIINC